MNFDRIAHTGVALALLFMAVGCLEQPLDESTPDAASETGAALRSVAPDIAPSDDSAETDAPDVSGLTDAPTDITDLDTDDSDDANTAADVVIESPDTAQDDTAQTDANPADTAPPDTAAVDVFEDDAANVDAGFSNDAGTVPVDAGAPLPNGCTQDVGCDDNKPCTDGKCLADGTCIFKTAANDSLCVPADLCTIDRKCAFGECVYQPKVCKTNKVCRLSACDTKTGACIETFKKFNSYCNDGNPCTNKGKCQLDGTCKSQPRPDKSPCKGKTPCKIHWCMQTKCVPHAPKFCEDYNPCTFDDCDPKYDDCFHLKKTTGTACDDGLPCTEKDACTLGYCWGKEKKKGCNGLPVDTCGNLTCDAGESGSSCGVDCHWKGHPAWMIWWAGCKPQVIKCLNDKPCTKLAGCMIHCKYDPLGGHTKKKCNNDCKIAAPKASWDMYQAASNCAKKLG